MQDHRSIPLAVLREFYRDQVELSSLRAVADRAGVGRTTLHNFLNEGTTPQPRVRRLLGLWYLAQQNEADAVQPYVSALAILLSGIPTAEQDAASALLVDALVSIYRDRAPVPRWLELLAKS